MLYEVITHFDAGWQGVSKTNGNRRGASRAPTLWASHGSLRRCHALRAVQALGRKGLAALGAAGVQHATAAFGGHAGAEAVTAAGGATDTPADVPVGVQNRNNFV